SLDVSNFNTGSVISMNSMFYGCSGLISLDVSNFNTSSITNMDGMFEFCSILTTIYASAGFDTTSVTDSDNMFTGCNSLQGVNGTTYSGSYTNKEYARIDGGPTSATPGYFTPAP
ncbi:MAG: BspA family leucine-rich repeat surface protein, partial [Spirochaetaceae bacterium]|nr:BspA family leucine-rich repeat surface protein [Spirochaetaceae bacterium]